MKSVFQHLGAPAILRRAVRHAGARSARPSQRESHPGLHSSPRAMRPYACALSRVFAVSVRFRRRQTARCHRTSVTVLCVKPNVTQTWPSLLTHTPSSSLAVAHAPHEQEAGPDFTFSSLNLERLCHLQWHHSAACSLPVSQLPRSTREASQVTGEPVRPPTAPLPAIVSHSGCADTSTPRLAQGETHTAPVPAFLSEGPAAGPSLLPVPPPVTGRSAPHQPPPYGGKAAGSGRAPTPLHPAPRATLPTPERRAAAGLTLATAPPAEPASPLPRWLLYPRPGRLSPSRTPGRSMSSGRRRAAAGRGRARGSGASPAPSAAQSRWRWPCRAARRRGAEPSPAQGGRAQPRR